MLALTLSSSPAHGAAPSVQRWYAGTLSISHSAPLPVRIDILGEQVFVQDDGETIQQANVRVTFNHRTRAIRVQFDEVFGNCALSGYTDTLTGVLSRTDGRISGRYRSAGGPDAFSSTFALRPGQPVRGPVTCEANEDQQPLT